MPSWVPSAHLLLLTNMVFWATNAIVGKVAAEDGIEPVVLAILRWGIAICLLLPFTWRVLWSYREDIWRRKGPLFLQGFLSVGCYNTLLYGALHNTTAINATLVGSTMPAITLLLAFLFVGETATPRKLAGMALTVIGVVLVISHGDLDVLLSLSFGRGELLMLIATLCWGGFSVSLRRWPPGLPPLAFLSVQTIGGLVVLIPLFIGGLAMGMTVPMTPNMLWIAPYVALIPSIGAFILWNQGVKMLGAGMASIYVNLIPVFTALLAVPLLGEQVAWYHLAGLMFCTSGVVLA
ncbi:MAG: DMT family transporter, partial [Rhodospirillaceae bacterium]